MRKKQNDEHQHGDAQRLVVHDDPLTAESNKHGTDARGVTKSPARNLWSESDLPGDPGSNFTSSCCCCPLSTRRTSVLSWEFGAGLRDFTLSGGVQLGEFPQTEARMACYILDKGVL